MSPQIYYLVHDVARKRAVDAVLSAPMGWKVTLREPGRSLDQNGLMWPLLKCFSGQLKWPVNGELMRMSSDDWKDVLTAGFNREHLRIAQGLDSGVVLLGLRTSNFSKRRFSEFIEFLYATGVERGVEFEERPQIILPEARAA